LLLSRSGLGVRHRHQSPRSVCASGHTPNDAAELTRRLTNGSLSPPPCGHPTPSLPPNPNTPIHHKGTDRQPSLSVATTPCPQPRQVTLHPTPPRPSIHSFLTCVCTATPAPSQIGTSPEPLEPNSPPMAPLSPPDSAQGWSCGGSIDGSNSLDSASDSEGGSPPHVRCLAHSHTRERTHAHTHTHAHAHTHIHTYTHTYTHTHTHTHTSMLSTLTLTLTFLFLDLLVSVAPGAHG
jgi:hypothetical protein